MTASRTTAYDEVLYPSMTFPQTHPERLATIATLFGMNPASPRQCRVLEIGCGRGWNLFPMAYDLPESTFVGFDYAARPVALGTEEAATLGLKNLRLLHQDIMGDSAGLGSFDYIIAHGIYSWTPPAVRDRVLALCRAHLAPLGVAFVSYMTYPGGYLPQMVREMMRFHVQHFEGPQHQVRQARAMLKLLMDAQTHDTPYRGVLEQAYERIRRKSNEYFYHDDLSGSYAPCYFHQFMDHAQQHQLQFLAEAVFFETFGRGYSPNVEAALDSLGGNVTLEQQYLDFFHGRAFRQTLLCHEEIPLERAIPPDRLQGFYLALPMLQAGIAGKDASSGETEAMREIERLAGFFEAPDKPLVQAALTYLGAEWPRSVAFEDLVEAACYERDAASKEHDARTLGQALLQLYASNAIELHLHQPDFVAEAGPRPMASPIARMQIQKNPFVSTLSFGGVQVDDPISRMVLPLLDGTRDRAALAEILMEHITDGTFAIKQNDHPLTDRAQVAEALPFILDQTLDNLARKKLLLA